MPKKSEEKKESKFKVSSREISNPLLSHQSKKLNPYWYKNKYLPLCRSNLGASLRILSILSKINSPLPLVTLSIFEREKVSKLGIYPLLKGHVQLCLIEIKVAIPS